MKKKKKKCKLNLFVFSCFLSNIIFSTKLLLKKHER